jgi:hypothetical protein
MKVMDLAKPCQQRQNWYLLGKNQDCHIERSRDVLTSGVITG